MSIHDPSIPSSALVNGTATIPNGHSDPPTLQELIQQKDAMESELRALGALLEGYGVRMESSLTTFDGYPRDDIDVAQVATTRTRIIRLKNDWKGVMAKIEVGLHEYFANAPPSPPPSSTGAGTSTTLPTRTNTASHTTASTPAAPEPDVVPAPQLPFARIASVAPASPAFTAGLLEGDAVRRFGSVDWNTAPGERMGAISEIVRTAAEQRRVVQVLVERNEGEEVELQLRPRDWDGRGNLGCRLVPM